MAVELEIRDGDPWWLSPDVWTVPGDPEGTPGAPIAGSPCFLWARVRNNGSSNVANATVRFYWANPATGFNRNTATQIGTSFVSLPSGTVAEVLCLTPWIPTIVNNGHECVLAEAFHDIFDPLPSGPTFNVPTDRHVAQRNLTVMQAVTGFFHVAFEIHNTSRKPRSFDLHVREGKLAGLRPLAEYLKEITPFLTQDNEAGKAGLLAELCPTEADLKYAKPKIEGLKIAAHGRAGLSVAGRVKGPASLFHVEQWDGERLVGGLSVLAVNSNEKRQSRGRARKK